MTDTMYYRIIKLLREAYPKWISVKDISMKTGVTPPIIGTYLKSADVEKEKTRFGILYRLKNPDLYHLILLLNEYIESTNSNETKNVLREIKMRLGQ